MTAYLVDANVFIQAKNFHYGFEFCPAFWDWLIYQNDLGTVASVRMVLDELKKKDDELTEWASARGDAFFLPPCSSMTGALRELSKWAIGQQYTQKAFAKFFGGADPMLIAHAMTLECIVVTHEVPEDTLGKIKIPNACDALNVDWMTPYKMLGRESAKFVLKSGCTRT